MLLMKKPKFNAQQESWLSDVIDEWHKDWDQKLVRDPRQPHNLGIAKEALKALLFHVSDCPKDEKPEPSKEE